METIILVLLPIVVSGLGYLTYKHPPIARQILRVIMTICLIAMVLLEVFMSGSENGFSKSKDIILTYSNVDSSFFRKNNYPKEMFDSLYKIYSFESEQNKNLYNRINVIAEADKQTEWNIFLYLCLALGITIILIVLSYMFDDLWNSNTMGLKPIG